MLAPPRVCLHGGVVGPFIPPLCRQSQHHVRPACSHWPGGLPAFGQGGWVRALHAASMVLISLYFRHLVTAIYLTL